MILESQMKPEDALEELEASVKRIRSEYDDCQIDNIEFVDWLRDELRSAYNVLG